MRKLLFAVGIISILCACSEKPEQQILGKWESSGIFRAEFTPDTALWVRGGCKHSGYTRETAQINGQKFNVVSFTCKESIPDGKPMTLQISAAIMDKDAILFMNMNFYRIN